MRAGSRLQVLTRLIRRLMTSAPKLQNRSWSARSHPLPPHRKRSITSRTANQSAPETRKARRFKWITLPRPRIAWACPSKATRAKNKAWATKYWMWRTLHWTGRFKVRSMRSKLIIIMQQRPARFSKTVSPWSSRSPANSARQSSSRKLRKDWAPAVETTVPIKWWARSNGWGCRHSRWPE